MTGSSSTRPTTSPTTSSAALLPTLATRPNPQVWATSSAPLDPGRHPESSTLRSLVKRGRTGEPGMAYMEWAADEGDDSADVDAWRRANPSLGIRISEEFLGQRPVVPLRRRLSP